MYGCRCVFESFSVSTGIFECHHFHPIHFLRYCSPTVARATLLSACQLGITSEVKGKLAKSGYFGENGQMYHGIPMLFSATLCSSFFANIVANPFDVVKSRLQNMPITADGKAMYSGMADCFVKSVRLEGPAVLFSGFTPAFVKVSLFRVLIDIVSIVKPSRKVLIKICFVSLACPIHRNFIDSRGQAYQGPYWKGCSVMIGEM